MGFALEAKSLAEGSAEGECSPPPAPPLVSPVLTVEGPGFTTVELCQDGEDICLTACEGEMEMSGQDPNCEDMQRKDQRLPFQIFPDPVEVVLGPETTLNSLGHNNEKERLPSIVVEPTEVSEVESGELRWPPENMDMEEDEEDLFLEQCIPPANIADWGEEEEEEETTVILNPQQGLTLIDLQTDAFRDDTPTLPPSSAPALN
ncbi:uncharacterized protein lbhl [Notolabrus celidotus]|uniref:uncharacterized protein lbhl n=1 Tax=Notolabrus celidotus TaxID=1203425 RepID=UPI0014904FC1|nr:uncharacterized protein lbhl [Notolabrus celidotus]